MAIIVGDIHGRIEKVKAFLAYRPDQDHVALGDYLDSFCEPPERQLDALQLLMDSDAVLILGNHDVHYLDYPLFQFAGYNLPWADEFNQVLEKNIKRFVPSCLIDGWFCTHAGLNVTLAKNYTAEDLDDIFNGAWLRYLVERKWEGNYRFRSIFTFDYMAESKLVPDSIKQVHGHDEHSEPGFTKPNVVSIGNNDKGTAWIFDTGTGEIKNIWRQVNAI